MKPKYKIIRVKKGWQIQRPDGSMVNELTFSTLYQAEVYLDRIIVMGWAI